MPKAKTVTAPTEERTESRRADERQVPTRSAEMKTLIKLVLDTSASMYASGAIGEAKDGLERLCQAISTEDLLKLSVELSVDVFADDATTARPFGPVEGFSAKAFLAELPQVGFGTRIGNAALHSVGDVEPSSASRVTASATPWSSSSPMARILTRTPYSRPHAASASLSPKGTFASSRSVSRTPTCSSSPDSPSSL
jgi:hypothetical protein